MKRLLAIIFLAVVLFGAYWFFFKKDSHPSEAKQHAIKIKKHSEEFNQSIANALNEYFNLRNAFADGDTVKIKAQVPKFNASVDSIKLDDLKKDDSLILASVQQQVSDIKANADDILLQKDITEMREDFRKPHFLKYGYKLFPQGCFQLRLECFNEFRVRCIDFGIGEGLFRRAVGEGVRQAFLSLGNIFSAEHVKQFHVFEIRGLGLLYDL